MTKNFDPRQGDVHLMPTHDGIKPINALPDGCVEIPIDGNRIVLAHGEVTGHAHAIYDHVAANLREQLADQVDAQTPRDWAGAAGEVADAAIARAQSRARLWRAPSGDRYLEVKETVTLRHEEHTAHTLPPGIYKLPVQTEYSPQELRRVAD